MFLILRQAHSKPILAPLPAAIVASIDKYIYFPVRKISTLTPMQRITAYGITSHYHNHTANITPRSKRRAFRASWKRRILGAFPDKAWRAPAHSADA
ncbi:hypothetical protein CHELA40_11300 [Chelatococcus asaccharovorans]|nr:hypothetical protein CHELA40_11300 [Chelatococcus asaccharovorans]CAH1685039.1 hypothetical protein CHELA17_64300 [Chelatococcus asaccharovorans]